VIGGGHGHGGLADATRPDNRHKRRCGTRLASVATTAHAQSPVWSGNRNAVMFGLQAAAALQSIQFSGATKR